MNNQKVLMLGFVGMLSLSSQVGARMNEDAGPWKPTLESISAHQAPEWLKDAKIGVQFVGAPLDLNDEEWYQWSRAVQRARQLGCVESDEDTRTHINDFKVVGGIKYIWDVQAPENLDEMMKAYERIGAKFLVSMLQGAYPGTEGLLMTEDELAAARRAGLKVGIHYNLLRREMSPSIGDPGYVDWWRNRLKTEIGKVDADFLFFDGCQSTSDYFKSPELVAWFYNRADKKGKAVWVNEDLGTDCREKWQYGDVFEGEGYTVSGITPKTFVNWDILRNEWNCWVNEFGMHKRNAMEWEWIYRDPADMLEVFIYNVSVGGVWCVQMINTQQAWENMYEIGDWLAVNGEAIYGTRPNGEPDPDCHRMPDERTAEKPKDLPNVWNWRFEQTQAVARQHGPVYFTRKGGTVYAIHWGLPDGEVVLPAIVAKPGSVIRMLGVDTELAWKQRGGDIVVEMPHETPCKYAVSFVIQSVID